MKNAVHGIACAVINKDGKVLLLKRSPGKKLFPNKWFVVGAYPLGKNDDFESKAHIEMVDETGFDGRITKKGEVLKMEVNGQIIDIHTFLAIRDFDEVKINNEHTEYKWVDINELKKTNIVPGTYEMIDNLFEK